MVLESTALLAFAAVTHVGRELRGLRDEQTLLDGNLGVLRHIVERLQESNDRFARVHSLARSRSDMTWHRDSLDEPISDGANVG